MNRDLSALQSLVFNRITIGTFLALWAIAIAGFVWLASGIWAPTGVIMAYDLIFIKLLNAPGFVLLSAVLPNSFVVSPLGIFLVVSFGYVLVSLLVSTSYHFLHRAARVN